MLFRARQFPGASFMFLSEEGKHQTPCLWRQCKDTAEARGGVRRFSFLGSGPVLRAVVEFLVLCSTSWFRVQVFFEKRQSPRTLHRFFVASFERGKHIFTVFELSYVPCVSSLLMAWTFD